MNAVDTNVLLYMHDPRDPVKREHATDLVASLVDGVPLWQVACEFVAASRKLSRVGFTEQHAVFEIARMSDSWRMVLPAWEVFEGATRLRQRRSLSFWDALIISACLEAGVSRLYTENFTGHPEIDGLGIVNPFADHAPT
ncbi:MAG: PIN domain-containing protein [Planctomycetes bacterium]|nr:PIN domain-containing protein [Planctomycetota bacterium]